MQPCDKPTQIKSKKNFYWNKHTLFFWCESFPISRVRHIHWLFFSSMSFMTFWRASWLAQAHPATSEANSSKSTHLSSFWSTHLNISSSLFVCKDEIQEISFSLASLECLRITYTVKNSLLMFNVMRFSMFLITDSHFSLVCFEEFANSASLFIWQFIAKLCLRPFCCALSGTPKQTQFSYWGH